MDPQRLGEGSGGLSGALQELGHLIFKSWRLIRVENNKTARFKPLAHVTLSACGLETCPLPMRCVLCLQEGELGDV